MLLKECLRLLLKMKRGLNYRCTSCLSILLAFIGIFVSLSTLGIRDPALP